MSEFTPGPWMVDDDYFIGTQKGTIAEVLDTYDGLETSEFLANARLIAAAPLLYEALESIVESGWLCGSAAHLHAKAMDALDAAKEASK